MCTVLFMTGFHPSTRARDLAYEFERFGPLVRCDIPAPRKPNAPHNPYAFVEFEHARDAENAYFDMHKRDFEGSQLSIQWAKNPPSSTWGSGRDRERDSRHPPPHRSSRGGRSRSRSPRRRDHGYDRHHDRARDHRDGRDIDRECDHDDRRSRSKGPDRRRSPSPDRDRRRDDRERDRDGRNREAGRERPRSPISPGNEEVNDDGHGWEGG